MFIKTIVRQGEQIHNLERMLNQGKESNSDLRDEVAEKNLEIRRLKQFKNIITNIMTNKGTIVDKYDKINEVIISYETK